MEGMNTNIMDINRILDEARNLGCSDLHFTAGLPPVVRLHGSIRKLSGYPDCTEPIIVNIINQITSIKHKSQISKGLDTDFSYVSTAGFRHRVNVYRQRGYHAVAIRLLRNDIPDPCPTFPCRLPSANSHGAARSGAGNRPYRLR